MKMLVNRTAVSSALPFVLDDLKFQIRFTESDYDAEFIKLGKAAAAEFEQFAQIALLTQTIRVMIFDPAQDSGLRLPIGPVADDDVPTVTIDGEAFTGFDFVGGKRPYIRWLASYFLHTPSRITIEYQAGFGATTSDIPEDIAQAVMDQTCLYFDARSPMDAKSLTTSPHMTRIAARYRGIYV